MDAEVKIELELELPPNLSNNRWHWRTKLTKKQNYFMGCTVRLRNGELPEPPPEPMARATITVHADVWSIMDIDNLFARLKWPLDWLQEEGYLENDRPGILEWSGLPTQRTNRKKQGLFITLEDR